ncbi:MAG TPA: hypothetical protein VF435_09460 [Pyrinomonadaceae bacterium]
MTNNTFKKVLWWLCLFVAPAVLITIELFHPAGFTQNPGMYEYLYKPEPYNPQYSALGYFGPQWWFTLHMIQTPMVGLVAVGLWLLADKVDSSEGLAATIFAWLSRVATFVFLIYYTALDSIGGIGLGKTIEITEQLAREGKLTPEQVMGVAQVLNQTWINPWVGGVGSFISLTGSWAVFISTLLLAIALFLTEKAPWPALILLVAFGWELQVSHTMPHGPIAFGLLIISALWIWWSGRRQRELST